MQEPEGNNETEKSNGPGHYIKTLTTSRVCLK